MVRYLMRKSKFAKESSLSRLWSSKIYMIHSINRAQSFSPMHTYILAELGTSTLSTDLPPIQEHLLKHAFVTKRDTFAIEKILKTKGIRVLVKWQDYKVPTWEPKSLIVQQQ